MYSGVFPQLFYNRLILIFVPKAIDSKLEMYRCVCIYMYVVRSDAQDEFPDGTTWALRQMRLKSLKT